MTLSGLKVTQQDKFSVIFDSDRKLVHIEMFPITLIHRPEQAKI